MDFVDSIVYYIIDYSYQFSYLAVFLLIMVGNIGIPLPAELVLLVAGYLASIGVMNIYVLIVVAIISTLISDNISFWVGRKKGVKVLHSNLAGRFFLTPRRLVKLENYFKKHGGKMVLAARALLGFRVIGFIFAGSSKMQWKIFQKYNILGTLIWVPIITLIGFILGSGFMVAWNFIEPVRYVIIGLMVVLIVGLFFVRKFKRNNIK